MEIRPVISFILFKSNSIVFCKVMKDVKEYLSETVGFDWSEFNRRQKCSCLILYFRNKFLLHNLTMQKLRRNIFVAKMSNST